MPGELISREALARIVPRAAALQASERSGARDGALTVLWPEILPGVALGVQQPARDPFGAERFEYGSDGGFVEHKRSSS